jgi:hypothetical protein
MDEKKNFKKLGIDQEYLTLSILRSTIMAQIPP